MTRHSPHVPRRGPVVECAATGPLYVPLKRVTNERRSSTNRSRVILRTRVEGSSPDELLQDVGARLDQIGVPWVILRDERPPRDHIREVDLLTVPESTTSLEAALRACGFVPLPSYGRGTHQFYLAYEARRAPLLPPTLSADQLVPLVRDGSWDRVLRTRAALLRRALRREPVLSMRRVTKTAVGRTLEKPRQFRHRRGLTVALLGPGGVGKSTVARATEGFAFPARRIVVCITGRRAIRRRSPSTPRSGSTRSVPEVGTVTLPGSTSSTTVAGSCCRWSFRGPRQPGRLLGVLGDRGPT